MAQPKDQEIDETGAATELTLAAIYVRVSSTGQLDRDGDSDGYSIPAQVQACERKAAELGCEVARAYVERAESARSDDRPVLQRMLRELPELGVRYLIVHKVDRLARNRLDDATLYQRLVGMNITLVSASENIDATPAGRLMHGMLATFAEYYSNNLATEIKKGLHQKHQLGGTPFRPPVGYLPTRDANNADVRTVTVDPERAPLVQLAFDLYATGDWSLHRLAEHLQSLGLTSRPTAKRGPAPLRMTSIHKLLNNIYYVGIVEYQGRRVLGRHEALVDRDTFDRVQAHLAARSVAGDRPSKHEHYLRGTLYCAECGGRLLFTINSGNGGRYEYFACINRATRRPQASCRSRHYQAALIEKAIEEHYATVRLTAAKQQEIRDDVEADATERAEAVNREIRRHQRTIRDLKANQAHLVQLSYKGLVSDDVLASEQDRLAKAEKDASDLLTKAQVQATELDAQLEEALRRTRSPQAAYRAGTPLERRILNQTFFKQILIGEDSQIVDATLTPTYAAVAAWHPEFGQPVTIPAVPDGTKTALTGRRDQRPDRGPSSWDHGLTFERMVETAGIEPASAIA